MFHTNRYMRLPYYCPENQEVTIVKDDISQSDFIEKILKATKNRDVNRISTRLKFESFNSFLIKSFIKILKKRNDYFNLHSKI